VTDEKADSVRDLNSNLRKNSHVCEDKDEGACRGM
jgi:hypothetical protein